MVQRKFARYVERGMTDATKKLDDWATRGLSDAVKQGIDEYGFRLGVAAYDNMKLPSIAQARSPWYVGLRYKRKKRFHSEPERTAEPAGWQIRVAPQFLALWQEAGTKPHLLFSPNTMRARAFAKSAFKQRKVSKKIAELESKGSLTDKERITLEKAKRGRTKRSGSMDDLLAARDTTVTIGYSDPSYIPKPTRRGYNSDWFKGNTPTNTTGKNAGQPRPVAVKANTQIRHPGTPATRPIARAAPRIASAHADRMAALLAQAYEKRGR